MTINTVSSIRKFSISMAIGALLLSTSALNASKDEVATGRVAGMTQSADVLFPDTLHHWPTIVVGDIDPATLHHWPDAAVADFDPDTLHHWDSSAVAVASLDPLTLHHWG